MSGALPRLWRFGRALLRGSSRPARTARRRPTVRPRDFQRARVYRWEAEHVFPLAADRLTLEQCRALVERAYRWREAPGSRPGWAPPTVTDGRGRRHACGSRTAIKLPRWARTRAVVLHEAPTAWPMTSTGRSLSPSTWGCSSGLPNSTAGTSWPR